MRNYQISIFELHRRAERAASSGKDSTPPFKRERYITEVQSIFDKQISSFDSLIETIVIWRPIDTELKYDIPHLQSTYSEYINEYREILSKAIDGEYGLFHPSLLGLCLNINEEFESKIKLRYNAILFIIGRLIQVDKQFFDHDLSIEERWLELERFAGRDGVAELGRLLFPELQQYEALHKRTSLVLPTAAPEFYVGLRGPETPPEFVQRVYKPWLGQGLTRAHLAKLDPKLYTAINNWLSRPGNVWPDDVDLPTKSEHTSRLIDKVQTEGASALPIEGPHSLKALASLEAAQRRRSGQKRK